jgi:hypothetical protein
MVSIHMDKLEAEIKLGVEDALADFPETNPDDVVHEIVNNMTIGHSQSVRNEMRRRFGFS